MLGLIIKLQQKNLEIVKNQLVDFISQSNEESKFYLYPEPSIFKNIGNAVGSISNYKQERFELKEGLKKTIDIFDNELFLSDKTILIITDSVTDTDLNYFELILKKHYMTECKVVVVTNQDISGEVKIIKTDFKNIGEILGNK